MNGLPYGTQHRVEVRARNAIGESERPGTAILDYDLPPDPPVAGQAVAGKNRIDLDWSAPPGPGGAVDHYTVTCDGAAVAENVKSTRLTVGDLRAGVPHVCAVSAVGRKGASVAAGFNAAVPYGEPGQPAAPRVAWAGDGSVGVDWDPVPETGAGVEYELLVNGRVADGCGATACAVGLASGQTATFQVRATSERSDGGSKTSDPTGPLRQGPAELEALAAPALTASTASPAGDAWVAAAWPAAPVRPGFETVGSWVFDGRSRAAPSARFDGLGAGAHTAQAVFCLRSEGGVPIVGGFPVARLCVESPQARVDVATLPGPPLECAATRPEPRTVAVRCGGPADWGGLPGSWRASLNGGTARDQVAGAFQVDIPAAALGGGQVEVWTHNSLGRSPKVAVAYPAWENRQGAGAAPGSEAEPSSGSGAASGLGVPAGANANPEADSGGGVNRNVNLNRNTAFGGRTQGEPWTSTL
jgi:hypothetical protein